MAETCERTERLIAAAYQKLNTGANADLGATVFYGDAAILTMLEGIARELCDLNQHIAKQNHA